MSMYHDDHREDEERLLSGHSSPGPTSRPAPRQRASRKIMIWLLLTQLMIVGLLIYALHPLINLLIRNHELFPALLKLSPPQTSEMPRPNQVSKSSIPRVFHQTSATNDIPDKWKDSQKSCQEKYSDYEYMHWTDETFREFLAAEYPWFSETWDDYAFPIQRADSLRYFVLYHYGGLYLDMDTQCNQSIPIQQLELGPGPHHAVFQATRPTGVTNDFMFSSARHPAYGQLISQLPVSYKKTRFWARLQPYSNIMMSTGPLFVTLVLMDYLLQQPASSLETVHVVAPPELGPYMTDLQSSTWHGADAQILIWLGRRPWTWFVLGGLGVGFGLLIINLCMIKLYGAWSRRRSFIFSSKEVKLI